MYYVYILKCRDESYYIGSTHNLTGRIETHSSGNGPTFTAKRLPIELVHQEIFATLEEAVNRERQLKRWTRAKKEALISGNGKQLTQLATCRQVQRGSELARGPALSLPKGDRSSVGRATDF